MNAGTAVAIAATFVWLGMVLAISFLEAPLKFRAPGITIPLGLGIGRLVFRALNAVEVVLAVAITVAVFADGPSSGTPAELWVAMGVLLVQVLIVRPRLTRRSDAVLAGDDAPRSHAHYWYVGLEVLKVIALLVGGIALLVDV
ncbi:hypothetical protein [Aldersonia kunmingensis]|uniref:hypothetical protein n=1 Tax=Aldersonia kunmingensis TaxID=408066 RepID=UPI00082B79F3|nr:hypothetical protein [Aldersonia kunmingensis]